jgi:hypothetical protein
MSCSVSRAFWGVKRYAAVVPPVVPHKGRTSIAERSFGVQGSQAIGLRIGGSQERGIGRGRDFQPKTWYWYRRSSLGLDSVSGTS